MSDRFWLLPGDCLESMRDIADGSVDAVVTDPPYGLSFMGKKWDYDVPSEAIWAECLRVLKPGGHFLAFAGTRTQHRMAVRIEDAGFEIRDMIAWVYGSGFPKSLDVSKAIDKLDAAEAQEREVVGREKNWGASKAEDGKAAYGDYAGGWDVTAPATEAARQWQGWGTALKPALEPITVARKPLVGTVVANVLAHGTGAINVDGCRIHADDAQAGRTRHGGGVVGAGTSYELPDSRGEMPAGRWPANLIHDGSDEVLAVFPETTSGTFSGHRNKPKTRGVYGEFALQDERGHVGDTGSAARFFYCAKASKKDRNEGCENMPLKVAGGMSGRSDGSMGSVTYNNNNNHPTVKPTDLMRYLCRLVTPPGGLILDPFMGSGSTGKAAMLEGFNFIGCEMSDEYLAIAERRISDALAKALAA